MKGRDQKAFDRLKVEFLPEALEIVEKPAAPLGSMIIWFVFLLLLAFLLWACFGRVDEVATARGQIMSDDGVQELQAAGTGIVTEVHVREGQSVKKGEILYSMDREVERLNIEYSEGEAGLLELRAELLNQMLLGKDIESYRNGNYDKEQMAVIEEMITFGQSAELSVQEYETAVQNAKNQYEIAQKAVAANKDADDYLQEQKDLQKQSHDLENTAGIELEILQNNYDYAKQEAQKYKKLYETGAVSKADWEKKENEAETLKRQVEIKQIELKGTEITKQSEKSNMDYQISENEANKTARQGTLAEMKSNYEMAVLNLDNAKKQREGTLYEQKEQCIAKLKEYGITLAQQYYEYENKDITAPYDGVVKTLNIGKEGAVVTATQVVAEILPGASQTIVEAEVSNQDIGFVETGQEVDIKVDTYDYQKYGRLTGNVIYISPDAIENERLEKIYKVNVLLDENSIHKLELAQGMQCSVEIKTDRRRIIEFFLEPLTEALDNSLKER
ncbi:MAG: HlyD family efflux transporter periplasmic adaptor subunit [Clostridium sp.]|nr:HlyD family efflux transporter periplasmic adaptor subunit [Clostridium sp.]